MSRGKHTKMIIVIISVWSNDSWFYFLLYISYILYNKHVLFYNKKILLKQYVETLPKQRKFSQKNHETKNR